MTSLETPEAEFDAYASSYEADLYAGLSLSGERQSYFVRGRVRWMARCFGEIGARPKSVLDFGCGAAPATHHFFEELGITSFVGLDVSRELLAMARENSAREGATYVHADDFVPDASIDLAYACGVFHHIPLVERNAAALLVYNSLAPGGLFAFWENNPWNPGTRLVMSRIPFDRNAVTLSVVEARRLLRGVGFDILHTTSAFYFPRALSWLRPLEPSLSGLPLGGQYMVLARKP